MTRHDLARGKNYRKEKEEKAIQEEGRGKKGERNGGTKPGIFK